MITEQQYAVKMNLLLWLLTGRSDDFVSDILNTGILYESQSEGYQIRQLRAKLNLEDTSSDFYVIATLASALLAVPPNFATPSECLTAFAFGGAKLEQPTSTLPLLPRDGKSWPTIVGDKAGAQGITRLVIEQTQTNEVVATDNFGKKYYWESKILDELSHRRVIIPEAENMGVLAHFKAQIWGAGSRVTVDFAPRVFPYKLFTDSIREDSGFIMALSEEGLLEGFVAAKKPYEQLGFAALVIIKKAARLLGESKLGITAKIKTPRGLEEVTVDLEWFSTLLSDTTNQNKLEAFHA